MSVATFRKELQNTVLSILQAEVGVGTDPTDYVKTFMPYLNVSNSPQDSFPHLVVNVQSVDEVKPGEMGTLKEIRAWQVGIYYVDLELTNYDNGESRRDNIVHKIDYRLQQNYRLSDLRVDDNEFSSKEYVYDSDITSALFDSSGQEGYYTFTAELSYLVRTAMN